MASSGDELKTSLVSDRQKLTITTDMLRPATPPSPSAWLSQASPGRPKTSPSERHDRPAIRNIFMTPPVKTRSRVAYTSAARPITFLPVSRPDRTSQSSLSSLLSLTSDNLAMSAYSSTASKGSMTPLTPPETPSRAKHPIHQPDTFRVGQVVDPEFYLPASCCSSPTSPAPSLDSFHSAQSTIADQAPGDDSEQFTRSFFFANDALPDFVPDADLQEIGHLADAFLDGEEPSSFSEVPSEDPDDSSPSVAESVSVQQSATERLLQALTPRSRISRSKMHKHFAWQKHLVWTIQKSAAQTSEAMVLLSSLRQIKLGRMAFKPSTSHTGSTSIHSATGASVEDEAYRLAVDNGDDRAASVTDEADEEAHASSDNYEGGDVDRSSPQQQDDDASDGQSATLISTKKESLLRRARVRLDKRFARRSHVRDIFASDENLLSDRALQTSIFARGNVNRAKKFRLRTPFPLKTLSATSSNLLVDTRARIVSASAKISTSPGRVNALTVALRTPRPHTVLGSRFSHDADSTDAVRKSPFASLFKSGSP